MNKFCVYLTCYRGKQLPPFYIGSSSTKRITEGYSGSVCSVEYKTIWDSEKLNNPELFTTKIISTHESRTEAYIKEQKLQKALNVVSSSMYVNKSYALERNDNTGIILNEQWRRNLSKSTKGKPKSETTKQKMRKPKTPEHNKKVSENKLNMIPVKCPFCNKEGNIAVMTRFHFGKCKLNPNKIDDLKTCPHCGKIGRTNMTRYHFDNCKKKLV
jgi:hypothetical protein